MYPNVSSTLPNSNAYGNNSGGNNLFGLSDDPFAEIEKEKAENNFVGMSFDANMSSNTLGTNIPTGNNIYTQPQSGSMDWNWN